MCSKPAAWDRGRKPGWLQPTLGYGRMKGWGQEGLPAALRLRTGQPEMAPTGGKPLGGLLDMVARDV